jgi:zinc D-Ala-D-Ala dipeptidase
MRYPSDPRYHPGFATLIALLLLALLLAACATAPTDMPPSSTATPVPSSSSVPTAPPPTPTPTPLPIEPLQVKVYATDLLQAPKASAAVVATLPFRTALVAVSLQDASGYVGVRTGEGVGGFVRRADLAKTSSFLYAIVPAMTVTSAVPADTSPARFSHLVDVRKEAPGIAVELLYATADNFLGHAIYDRDFCLLQESTLHKLLEAQAIFHADGYSIKIYDAYRPYAVTVAMFAESPAGAVYLADPKKGSTHNRGCAVDMTVVDCDGNELLMPSRVDTLNATASRTGPMSAEARRNLDYVQGVMVRCGFSPYSAEWWHYNDDDRAVYPHLDIAFRDLTIVEDPAPPTISPPPLRDSRKTGYVSISPTPAP